MDVRSLIQFLQIVQDGSYTKAAETLYLAQPTLSKTIHNLEEELNVPLFQRNQRDKHHIELTDYGKQLVKVATPIVNEFQQIPAFVHDVTKPCEGKVDVAVTPMIASLYLAPHISEFCEKYPRIKLKMFECDTYAVKSRVEASNCDFGLCMNDPMLQKAKDLDVFPLFCDEIVALISTSNSLSTKSKIGMKELRNEPLNLYTSGHVIMDAILSRCQAEGFSPEINFSSGSSDLLIRLSEGGSGITILPKPFLETYRYKNLAVVPFDPVFPWDCCMIQRHNRYQTNVAKVYMEYVKETLLCRESAKH